MYNMEFADYVVSYFNKTECTVREAAKHCGVSKTTVHNILTKVKPNPTSARILARNKAERHIRGGQATKNKYEKLKKDLI